MSSRASGHSAGDNPPTDDTLAEYADILPAGTSQSWVRLAPHLPHHTYLVGGTALAIHLRHRVSRDLDFFTEEKFDARARDGGPGVDESHIASGGLGTDRYL